LVVKHIVEIQNHVVLEIENVDSMFVDVAFFDFGLFYLRNLGYGI